MYLDVQARLPNNFWARHLVDTVAMWLKCNSTHLPGWIVGDSEVIQLGIVRISTPASRHGGRNPAASAARRFLDAGAFVVANQAEFNQLR